MPAANPILTPDRGKAHSVALAVLCVLAVVQVIAMFRAVWLAKSRSLTPTSAAVAGVQNAAPVPAAGTALAGVPPPGRLTAAPTAPAHLAAVPPQAGPLSKSATQPATAAKTAAAAQSAGPPLDAEAQDLLDVARQLRPLGDLKGAIEVLKRIDLKSPDHPVVLDEMAQTFDQMGLADQAATTRAKLAAIKARPAPPPAAVDPTKILSLGDCSVVRDPSVTKGEKLTLRVPICSHPGVPVDPQGIDIEVFFFDLVNGQTIEQTKADLPVNTWVNPPVDWTNGEERLDVLYSMPEMTKELVKEIGQRKFHGYIVKLSYQGRLQDTVMEPASLGNFGAQPTAPPPTPAKAPARKGK